MRLTDYEEAITSRLMASAKYSRNVHAEDVKTILNFIDRLNALDKDAVMLDGRYITDYEIPAGIQKLITPAAVLVDVNSTSCKDVLKRSDVEDTHPVNYVELINAFTQLHTANKMDSHFVKVERHYESLFDAYPRMIYDGRVHWDDSRKVLPYELEVDLGLKDFYFNSSLEEWMDEVLIRHADEIFFS